MNTTTMPVNDTGNFPRSKIIKISVVVGLHIGIAYMLQSGLLHKAVQAAPPEPVIVTFVTPPQPPESKPQPKTVDVVKAPAVVPPPLPPLNIQVENTITVPPPASPAPRVAQETPAAPMAAPSVQPAPPAPATPRTVHGVEYIRPPAPVYPSISKRLGETGVVTLRVLINEKGLAEQAQVQKSSGSANLDDAGRQAAMRALFKPYMEDGKPVPVYVLVPINFQLG